MIADMKTYTFNLIALAVSFTNIDLFLKITLLIVTIGFTVQKWYLLNKDRKERNE